MTKPTIDPNVFFVIRDMQTGKYLHGHTGMYYYDIPTRVRLEKLIGNARIFATLDEAEGFLKSRTDFAHKLFDFHILRMKAEDITTPYVAL